MSRVERGSDVVLGRCSMATVLPRGARSILGPSCASIISCETSSDSVQPSAAVRGRGRMRRHSERRGGSGRRTVCTVLANRWPNAPASRATNNGSWEWLLGSPARHNTAGPTARAGEAHPMITSPAPCQATTVSRRGRRDIAHSGSSALLNHTAGSPPGPAGLVILQSPRRPFTARHPTRVFTAASCGRRRQSLAPPCLY
jgi:hypothetical protein